MSGMVDGSNGTVGNGEVLDGAQTRSRIRGSPRSTRASALAIASAARGAVGHLFAILVLSGCGSRPDEPVDVRAGVGLLTLYAEHPHPTIVVGQRDDEIVSLPIDRRRVMEGIAAEGRKAFPALLDMTASPRTRVVAASLIGEILLREARSPIDSELAPGFRVVRHATGEGKVFVEPERAATWTDDTVRALGDRLSRDGDVKR